MTCSRRLGSISAAPSEADLRRSGVSDPMLRFVMRARDQAKRLVRSLARKSIYTSKSQQETIPGPYTRMLGLEDEIGESAREDWAQQLRLWDLTVPSQRTQLSRILQSAAEEALVDVRRSFGKEDEEIVALLNQFEQQFDPTNLLVELPWVMA